MSQLYTTTVDGNGRAVELALTTRPIHDVSVPAGTIGPGEFTRGRLVVSGAPTVIPKVHSCDDDNDEFYLQTETPQAIARSPLGTMEEA